MGRAWQSARGRLADLLARRCRSQPRRLVGPVAGGRRGAGRGARPAPAPAAPRIGLKWPNDLWLMDGARRRGRKLGGVLIETVAAGDRAPGRDRRRPERAAAAGRRGQQRLRLPAGARRRRPPRRRCCTQRRRCRWCRRCSASSAEGFAALRRPLSRARPAARPARAHHAAKAWPRAWPAACRRARRAAGADGRPACVAVTSGEVSVRLAPATAATRGAGHAAGCIVLLLVVGQPRCSSPGRRAGSTSVTGMRAHRRARARAAGAPGAARAGRDPAAGRGERCDGAAAARRRGGQRARARRLPGGRPVRHRRRGVGRGRAAGAAAAAARRQLGRGEDRAPGQLDGLHGPLPEPRGAGEEGRGAAPHARRPSRRLQRTARAARRACRSAASTTAPPPSAALEQLAPARRAHARASSSCAAPATLHMLRAENADAALAAQLTALRSPQLGRGFVACGS